MNFEELWQRAKTFNILQKKSEFIELLKYIDTKLKKRRNYLEIGTNSGGTSSAFLQLFEKGYSIDIEHFPQSVERLKEINPNFEQIIKNSHTDTASRWVKMKHIKFDMIFIDGDHSKDGIQQDFYMYKEFLAQDGIIVLHDITYNGYIVNQVVEVKLFWDSIKDNYNYIEIQDKISFPDSLPVLNNLDIDKWGGIAIITGEKHA